jgi:hypothetical protein
VFSRSRRVEHIGQSSKEREEVLKALCTQLFQLCRHPLVRQ